MTGDLTTTPPVTVDPWTVDRTESTIHVRVSPTLDPVNAGTDTRPVPMRVTTVELKARNGRPWYMGLNGRRILKRDKPGEATGATRYQSFRMGDAGVSETWGITPPPWVHGLATEWISGRVS